MGPDGDISDLSSTSNNPTLSLPKLRSDSSNWATYSERILNYMTSKGYRRHVLGTARKPEELIERDGKFYKPSLSSLSSSTPSAKESETQPISDEALEKHEDSVDLYDQMQAAVREIIYHTVDKTTFIQVKNEKDAASVWKKVVSIHADKGSLYEANLLVQLQNIRYNEKESMREHTGRMTELRERLAEMNAPISDESFISYIRTSLSLAPSFRNLFTALSTTSRQTGKKLTPADVIWHLTEEAASVEIEDSINKSNTAMMAASSKPNEGKDKSKSSKSDLLCGNTIFCGCRGHTTEQCWEKGGGREGQAPDWWKKLNKGKKSSVNVAETESSNKEDEPENYAMLAFISPSLDSKSALVCTSDFRSEALAASEHSGIIIDSGASRHFSPDRAKFLNYVEFASNEPIRAADGRTFRALGKGDIQITLPNGNQKSTVITLKEVYYSPVMAFTLISVSCVDRAGFSLVFGGSSCQLKTSKYVTIGHIPQVRGLYRIFDTTSPSIPTHTANVAVKQISIDELHVRMGHVNHDDLRRMVEKGMVTGVDLDSSSQPGFCVKSKATRKPFPKESKSEYKAYGDKVVADVWGPAPVKSIGGKEYYLLFKDLFSHEERIYFLKHKSEVFDHYEKYEAWLRVQRGGTIRIFGSDRGGEFTSQEFTEYLENSGSIRHLTVHDSPASNGVAERANRTHLDGARAMLEGAKLPKYLWAEAVSHHVWLRNRVPTRTLYESKTPIEMGTNQKPDLSIVRPWGCKMWVKRLDAGKLEPRAEECRFVGVDSESKGYRVYWPGKNRVSVERDAYFNEKEALEPDEVSIEEENDLPTNLDHRQHLDNPSKTPPPTVNESNQPIMQPGTQVIKSSHTNKKPTRRNSLEGLPHFDNEDFGRGKRQRVPKSGSSAALADVEKLIDVKEIPDVDDGLSPKRTSPADQGGVDEDNWEWAMAMSGDEPSLREALNGGERQAWIDAIEAELTQMEKVNAWVPVIPPPDANVIPTMFVFRRKRNDKGSIVRYKARLVVKGYKQQFGVDYMDTFAQPSEHPLFAFSSHLPLKRVLPFINATSRTHI